MSISFVRGDFFSPQDDFNCDLFKDSVAIIEVNKGIIQELRPFSEDDFGGNENILDFSGQAILPGFLDLHFHWVQKDVMNMPKDNLLTWLEKFTWPNEGKFAQKEYCHEQAISFSRELLKRGTFGGACYGSIHEDSVHQAFKHFVGEFFVGNVLMTMNSPDYLLQEKECAKELIKSLAEKYKHKYAVTPRFAPTVHPDVMRYGGQCAKNLGSLIQSHLCETKEEIEWVLGIFKEFEGFEDVSSYSDIYHRCGMLGAQTIMGHGIYLSEEDLNLIKKTNTVIAHCPTSNAAIEQKGLGSGLFNFQQADRLGIRWGLGTDIGAGPFLSMFDVMESFVSQNKDVQSATYVKALNRATLENAKILGIAEKVGSLTPGKEANFVVVNNGVMGSSAEEYLKCLFQSVSQREDFESLVSTSLYRGDIVYQKPKE